MLMSSKLQNTKVLFLPLHLLLLQIQHQLQQTRLTNGSDDVSVTTFPKPSPHNAHVSYTVRQQQSNTEHKNPKNLAEKHNTSAGNQQPPVTGDPEP